MRLPRFRVDDHCGQQLLQSASTPTVALWHRRCWPGMGAVAGVAIRVQRLNYPSTGAASNLGRRPASSAAQPTTR